MIRNNCHVFEMETELFFSVIPRGGLAQIYAKSKCMLCRLNIDPFFTCKQGGRGGMHAAPAAASTQRR